MAMTKRIRVSFDLKMVAGSEEESALNRSLVEMAKLYLAGEKTDGLGLKLLQTSLESGPEAALEIALKKTIKEELVKTFSGKQFGVSNLRFEVKR
ncbi:hypothetical protein BOW94_gp29 [Escherichia phage GA2A]|uniref:HNS binding protein n=1 Tax=Escherichia phage GA2A TaxID=1755695 RepID=A0A1B0TRA7_9CAUD|nr:hypothetical protein BOW94_gp29 [Escherichia phage GA2A]ALP47794.1 hypothetical protein GA2A_27 [Escherichia phage GA2A]